MNAIEKAEAKKLAEFEAKKPKKKGKKKWANKKI